MKMPFACPACLTSGSVDDSLLGRQVKCKNCDHRFVISGPSDREVEGYSLDDPTRSDEGNPDNRGVFVSSRGDEPTIALSPRKPKPVSSGSKSRGSRGQGSRVAFRISLIRLGVFAAVVLTAIAFFAPRGLVISGSALIFLGTSMVLAGFAAGGYGAFSEDFLYGFFYLIFPLYTAYYLVTRWEDLWRWLVGSTAGVAMALLGTEMLRWAGVGE